MGVIPQYDYQLHTIVDYFYSGINDNTVHQASHEAMQFGCVLECLLHCIHVAPLEHGPIFLLKMDLVDGFY